MTNKLERIETASSIPKKTSVVIIGGGIIGVATALALVEQGIPTVLLEKGHLGGEQSSRNLGWIRKTNRHADDIPLALESDRLWKNFAERTGFTAGYRRAGIMFLAETESQLAAYENWHESVEQFNLDSRLLTSEDLRDHAPGGKKDWVGGIYTASDGYAEPALAVPAMAKCAIRKGLRVVQQCAVRNIVKSAGRVSGVVTEMGEIACDQVLLAGGAWSRRFLGNLGINLPTLPLVLSVLRSLPMTGPTDIAVGGPDFSFRRHQDGGFIITQRGRLEAPVTLDHLKIGWRFWEQLKAQHSILKLSFGRISVQDFLLAKSWHSQNPSPFEKVRALNPAVNHKINQEALNNLSKAWPTFKDIEIDESWAGLIDVTPDSTPVIDRLDEVPGLILATGFSGHGFGTGPAAGKLASEIIRDVTTSVDPKPYRFSRF